MKKLILAEIAGLIMLLAVYSTFMATFLTAYFAGNYKVLVMINEVGEAHIELIGLLISIPLVALLVHNRMKSYAESF